MKKITAVVVTFNPDLVLLKSNISTFIDHVDHILVVDNGSLNIGNITSELDTGKIKIINNRSNLGIAEALNIGLREAIENESDFLLTMDQDSCFLDNSFYQMKSFMLSNQSQNIAMVGPIMKDVTSGFIENIVNDVAHVKSVITSGALCRISDLNVVAGWDSSLFIDAVDFDICYKLRIAGKEIAKIKRAVMNHHLGESEVKNFIFTFLVTNHSPLRVYYASRNTVILLKRYFNKLPFEMIRLTISNFKKLIAILLFEKEKRKKTQYFIKGFFHGLENRTGKFRN